MMDVRINEELQRIVLKKATRATPEQQPFVSAQGKLDELNALVNAKIRPWSKQEYLELITSKRKEVVEIQERNATIEAANNKACADANALNAAAIASERNNLTNALDAVRVVRNRLLTECDWTHTTDSTLTTVKKTAWAAYRKKLRDITNTITSVADVEALVFPTPPE